MRSLIPTESPVTHRWHCSGFSRAGDVPNLGVCSPGVGSLGLGSPSPAFGNPRDAPATYLKLQLGRGSRNASATHSRLQTQNLRGARGNRSLRAEASGGGASGAGPERVGRGRPGPSGAGLAGSRFPAPRCPRDFVLPAARRSLSAPAR